MKPKFKIGQTVCERTEPVSGQTPAIITDIIEQNNKVFYRIIWHEKGQFAKSAILPEFRFKLAPICDEAVTIIRSEWDKMQEFIKDMDEKMKF